MNESTVVTQVEPGIDKVVLGRDSMPEIHFGGFEIGPYDSDRPRLPEDRDVEATLKVLEELLAADKYEVVGPEYWTDDRCECVAAQVNGHPIQLWWPAAPHAMDYPDSPNAQIDIRDMLKYAFDAYAETVAGRKEYEEDEEVRTHYEVTISPNRVLCTSLEVAREVLAKGEL
jgi:hypothetical protein